MLDDSWRFKHFQIHLWFHIFHLMKIYLSFYILHFLILQSLDTQESVNYSSLILSNILIILCILSNTLDLWLTNSIHHWKLRICYSLHFSIFPPINTNPLMINSAIVITCQLILKFMIFPIRINKDCLPGYLLQIPSLSIVYWVWF